jgi:cytochrome b561
MLSTLKQFSTRLVALHWLTFLLFAGAFYLGSTIDGIEQPAAKLPLYPYHFLGGTLVLLLTLLRAWFRLRDGAPAPAQAGGVLASRIALMVHKGLYVLLILLPASGLLMIFQTGVVAAVIANDPGKLPDLEKFTIHSVHGALATILLVTVGLHFAAALYHQFVLKDSLLRRMALKRYPD